MDGTYARVTVQATASTLPVDGAQKNNLTYYVQYRQAGSSAWTNGDTTTVTGGISVNQSFMLKRRGQCRDVRRSDRLRVPSGFIGHLRIVNALDEMPTKDHCGTCANQRLHGLRRGSDGDGQHAAVRFLRTDQCPKRDHWRHALFDKRGRYGNNWVDGKRIYSRMIAITTPATANAATTFSLNMSGMDAAWWTLRRLFWNTAIAGLSTIPATWRRMAAGSSWS